MPQRRLAFTLIELLVVILIISAVIAILIPTVGAVRTAARRNETQTLMNRIAQAAGMFQQDERRLPGYFSQQEMGSSENLTRGMSQMENVMLDLAGIPSATAPSPGDVIVGPTATNTIRFNVQLFGVPDAGSKSYFIPDPRYFVAQTSDGQQVGVAGHTASEGQPQLPDVVDAWGQPLLAWVVDDRAVVPVRQESDFARQSADSGLARFYWATNAAFLQATRLGRRGLDQTDTNVGSLLGPGQANRLRSMIGMLGSPSFPYRGDPPPPVNTLPTAPRAPFVLQSAGPDGVYVGKRDAGARQFPGGYIEYSVNFLAGETSDIMARFDDVLASGGN